MPSIQRLPVIQLPLGRLIWQQVNYLPRRLVVPGEVLFNIFLVANRRPALLEVSDFALGFGNKGYDVKLRIAGDGEDEQVAVLRQPCYAVTWEGPVGERSYWYDSTCIVQDLVSRCLECGVWYTASRTISDLP